jgi:hypothetical protein
MMNVTSICLALVDVHEKTRDEIPESVDPALFI